ncbi:MAG: tetratricopeptide repeat protein [Bacteroidetes bacterium]|nr:tetratricopeptide repeat protein [Bacteroidota bacterium]
MKLPCNGDKLKEGDTYFKYDHTILDSLLTLPQRPYPYFSMVGVDAILKIAFVVDTNNKVTKLEVKDYEIIHAFGSKTIYSMDIKELMNGKRHCYNEVKRMMELTNGLWKIGTKNGIKKETKFQLSFRFYTDVFKEDVEAMNKAKQDLNSNYDKVRVTSAIRPGPPESFNRLHNFASYEMNKKEYDVARVFLTEAHDHFPKDISILADMGETYYQLNEIANACVTWKMCTGDKNVENKLKEYCK